MPYRFAATLSAPQKTAITQDFATATGWKATVPDPLNPGQTIPNPVTRGKWLDNRIDGYLKSVVREHRLSVARAAAETAALADMTGLEEL